jgi:MFS family permease
MGAGLYVLLILVGLFLFVRMPVSESFLFAHAPAKRRSTLLGVYFLGSNLGGGVFTPVVGWLSDRFGFRYSFTVIALSILVLTAICGAILVIYRQAGRETQTSGSPQTT